VSVFPLVIIIIILIIIIIIIKYLVKKFGMLHWTTRTIWMCKRTFWSIWRRNVKSIEALDSCKNVSNNSIFTLWSPSHSSSINTRGFEGSKQEFEKQAFLRVKIISIYKLFTYKQISSSLVISFGSYSFWKWY